VKISQGKKKYYWRLLVQVCSYNSGKMIWKVLTSQNSSLQSNILCFGELNLTLLEWFCHNNPFVLCLCARLITESTEVLRQNSFLGSEAGRGVILTVIPPLL